MARELCGHWVGGWKVGDLIGSGGSAAVFRAQRSGHTAALKVIDPELVSEFGLESQKSRIDLEATLIGHDDPNLVKIIEARQCDKTGLLYVAMPLLAYNKLSDQIGRVPAEYIRSIITQVASAAKFLVDEGKCHRDIKADNVMVSADFSHAVLMDLGILSPVSSPALPGGEPSGERFIGTARYCPPEFVRKQEKKDAEGCRALTFYQLGGLLHDLIMGRRLFSDCEGPYAILLDAISNAIPLIESDNAPPDLVHLARDCLQKEPSQRLALVDFGRFLEPQLNPSFAARDRVKAALSGQPAVEGSAPASVPGAGRAVYRSLALSLRNQLRAACERNDDLIMPAIDQDGRPDCAMVIADFEASSRHNIYRDFRLVFEARRLPGQQPTFTLEAEPSWKDGAAGLGQRTRVCIIRGLDDNVETYFEDIVYRVMADAMAQPRSATGSTLKIGD